MTLGASFGGAIGVHVTGTLRGALAGASAGAALGTAAALGGITLFIKTVILGAVQGILAVVQDYFEHSSLQISESFLQGFSTGAWSQILGVAGIFGICPSHLQAAAITALLAGFNSLINDASVGYFSPERAFPRAFQAALLSLMTFGIVQRIIPQAVTVEMEEAFTSFLGAYVGAILPVGIYDLKTFLNWWREWGRDVDSMWDGNE